MSEYWFIPELLLKLCVTSEPSVAEEDNDI